MQCDIMPIKTKIKLRKCEVCKEKKKVAEFSIGKICNKCESSMPLDTASTLQDSSDDEVQIPVCDNLVLDTKVDIKTDNLQSLHAKVDNLTKRFDRMEVLLLGLMDLMGKMNYEMEMNKVDDE